MKQTLSPAYLRTVERFLSSVPVVPEGSAPELLHPLTEMRAHLQRPERRVVFVGAAKTGKSSVLNGLLGARLVPVSTHRTLPTVSEIGYDPVPSVSLVRRGRGEEGIPFDALLALAWDADDANPVETLRLRVPLQFLSHHTTLVDTPGLLQSAALDDVAYRELAAADLAVVVLAADKILSVEERRLVAEAQDLVHGNVVFVVNRLDLVDEEDRDDVLEWARSALRDSGNDLVGRARVFATSRPLGSVTPGGGVQNLEAWLAALLTTELGGRVADLSRLGVFEHRLQEMAARIRSERENAQTREADLRAHHFEHVMRERAAAHRAIAEGRVRLQSVPHRLSGLGDTFVADCVETGRRGVLSGDSTALQEIVERALKRYAEGVSAEVAEALSGVPITAPAFSLDDWIVRMPGPVSDSARELGGTVGDAITRLVDGGRAGREAGRAIGGWIGKNVLGVDAEAETIRRIQAVAQSLLVSVHTEAEHHLKDVAGLLGDADEMYQTWSPPSPDVEEAEHEARLWTALLQWCEGFLRAIQLAASEIAVTR